MIQKPWSRLRGMGWFPSDKEKSSSPPDKAQNDKCMYSPLDGGWGWCILVAASIVLFCNNGTDRSTSITYSILLNQFQGRPTISAVASGLHLCLRFLLMFMGAYIYKKIGARSTIIIGSLLETFGILLSLQAVKDWQFLLTFGVIGGIGTSLSYSGTVICLREYFETRRMFAFSMASVLMAVGHMVHPLALGWVVANYGYPGYVLTWASVALHMCVGGALCRPLADNYRHWKCNTGSGKYRIASCEDTRINTSTSDISSQKENRRGLVTEKSALVPLDPQDEAIPCRRTYILFIISIFLCTIAYYPPIVFIVDILEERGLTIGMAATVVGATNAFDVAWRIGLALFFDKDKLRPYCLCYIMMVMFLCGVGCAGLATFTGLPMSYLFGGVVSVGASNINTIYLVILSDIVSPSYFPTAVSTQGILQGLANFVGPSLSGLIREASGHNEGPLAFSCSVYLLALSLLVIDRIMARQSGR